jgi:hypothetical protein
MPNLMHFITGHGTLITHEHTPLIAHTADDIVTSETGLYGSGQGIPIANEYNYCKPDGTTDTAGSFAYWTDPIVDYDTGLASKPVGDHTPTLIGSNGRNAPAPWVPYTRAGCNFGTVAGADTELENTLPDVPHVFGAHSPEAKEAENPSARARLRPKRTSWGWRCTAPRAPLSAPTGRAPTCCPTSRAATTATKPCTATSSSSRSSARPGRSAACTARSSRTRTARSGSPATTA